MKELRHIRRSRARWQARRAARAAWWAGQGITSCRLRTLADWAEDVLQSNASSSFKDYVQSLLRDEWREELGLVH